MKFVLYCAFFKFIKFKFIEFKFLSSYFFLNCFQITNIFSRISINATQLEFIRNFPIFLLKIREFFVDYKKQRGRHRIKWDVHDA